MEKNRIYIGLAFAVTLVICLHFVWVPQAQSADTRIVRIYAQTGPNASTRIEPVKLWVKPETIVVFANWGKTEVMISFDEGAKCDEATVAAGGFKITKQCYVTDMWVAYGATTSLKFDKAGKYNYTVIFKGLGRKEKGTITVRLD